MEEVGEVVGEAASEAAAQASEAPTPEAPRATIVVEHKRLGAKSKLALQVGGGVLVVLALLKLKGMLFGEAGPATTYSSLCS